MQAQTQGGQIAQTVAPLLNLLLPGLGSAAGAAVPFVEDMIGSPTSYVPAAESKSGFGYAKGGTLSPSKALKILKDNKVHGKKLTKDQKKFFGWVAHKDKMQGGGNLGGPATESYRWKYGFEHLPMEEGTLEVDSAVIPQVQKKILHPQLKFFDYNEPTVIQNVKAFQEERGIQPTGYAGPQTLKELRTSNPELFPKQLYSAKQLEFQDKVRQAAKKVNPGDRLAMSERNLSALKSIPDLQGTINHCIGGVCNWLRTEVDGGVIDDYYSNFTFDEQAKEKGWRYFNNPKQGMPITGDIIQVRYPSYRNPATGEHNASRHAMIIVDDDETGYTIMDNAGSEQARIRRFSRDEIRARMSQKSGDRWGFYRKDFGDGGGKVSKPEKTIEDFFGKESTEYKPEFQLRVNQSTKVGRQQNKFVEGINEAIKNSDYDSIPQRDLANIATMAAALTAQESDEGRGERYKAKKFLTEPVKAYRQIQRGESMAAPLSSGLSQIDPSMISEDIKKKYLKKYKTDEGISRALFHNNKLAGKVTYEMLKERYKTYQNNPNLYGGDPQAFWYSLAKSWQLPTHALTEDGAKALSQMNIPYAENVFNNLDKYYIEGKGKMKKGGKLCKACGGKMKMQYGGNAMPDLNVLQGGQLNQIAPSTMEVDAHTPGALDSVELDQAYVSDNETISQMPDGSKYVFSDVLKNPFTGRTFAEDDKQLAKAESKIAKKRGKYGQHEKNTLKVIETLRQKLAGVNDQVREYDESINGKTFVDGKVGAQGGVRIPQNNPHWTTQPPYFMPNQIQNLPTAVVTAKGPNLLQRLNTADDNFMTGLWHGSGGDKFLPGIPAPGTTAYYTEPFKGIGRAAQAVAQSIFPGATPTSGPSMQRPDAGVMQPTQSQLIVPGLRPFGPPQPAPSGTTPNGRAALEMHISGYRPTTSALARSTSTGKSGQPAKKTAGKKANPKAVTSDFFTPTQIQGTEMPTAIGTPYTSELPFQWPLIWKSMPELSPSLPVSPLPTSVKSTTSKDVNQLAKSLLNKDGKLGNIPGSAAQGKFKGSGNFLKDVNWNHALQFGELAAKAALLLRGHDKPKVNTAPISYSPYDPSNALMQNQYAYNAAMQDVANSSSGNVMLSNMQQMAANKMRGNAQVMSQYDGMNKDLYRDYQARLGQRGAENIQYEHIGQADEAAYYNQLYDILSSVGNIGRAGQSTADSKQAAQLIIQSYPQIAEYMQEAFKNLKLKVG